MYREIYVQDCLFSNKNILFSLGSGAGSYAPTMHRYIYISISALLLSLTAPLALADTYVPVPHYEVQHVQVDVEIIRYAQKKVSPSEAKNIARRKVRGADVIDISLKGGTYKVRMQKKNGRVVEVYVDAASGRVR